MAKAQAVTRTDWLLLALGFSTGGLTPVQLQKVLFLLGERRKNVVGPDYYTFKPYNYGPFSQAIYSDVDLLASFLEQVEVDESRGRQLRSYRLTASGAQRVKELAKSAPAEGVAYLREVVPWAQQLTFADLVRAIYDAYPRMRAKSVFQDPQ